MRKRFVLCAWGAFALVVLVQAVHASAAAASPEWWDENWLWRRSITITPTADVPAGYQENILLNYDSDTAFENFQGLRQAGASGIRAHAGVLEAAGPDAGAG